MKPLQTILLSILIAWILFALSGCAHAPAIPKAVPSAAYVATQKVKLSLEKAKVSLAKIKEPEARKAEDDINTADIALDEASHKIESLQDQMRDLAQAKEVAQANELKAENAKRFWRAWTLRLSVVSGLLGLWIFRRPLLALCGIPFPL